MSEKGCKDCRLHSVQMRRKPIGVVSGDMELVEFEDDDHPFFICTDDDKEMGFQPDDGAPLGAGCGRFSTPTVVLSPELQRMMDQSAARAAAAPDEER